MGYAFEDFHTGDTIDLGTASVGRDEMLAFATRFDPQPFHTDPDAARKSIFGGLCASGLFTFALWMRAYADTVLHDSTSLGSPGGRELSWPAPVFPGDVLACRAEVGPTRISRSRPGTGLVELTGTARRKADDTPVLRFVVIGMFAPGQQSTAV
jgi:acyl dehydratase